MRRPVSQWMRKLSSRMLLSAAFAAAAAATVMHPAPAQAPVVCANWSAWIDRTAGPGGFHSSSNASASSGGTGATSYSSSSSANASSNGGAGSSALPTLHVQGWCTVRLVGSSVELRPHVPSSTNPNVYLMDLVVHAPAGPAVLGTGAASLSYATTVANPYRTLLIFPDGISVPVRQTL